MVIHTRYVYNKGKGGMDVQNYLYLILLFAVMILSFIAQGRVQSVFNQYAQVPSR